MEEGAEAKGPEEKPEASKTAGRFRRLGFPKIRRLKTSEKPGLSLEFSKRNLLITFLLIAILVMAFWIRALPARYEEFQEIDSFYLFRMSEYVLTHNWQLPEVDTLRYYPIGTKPLEMDYIMDYYFTVFVFSLGFNLFMSFFDFALLFPVMLGTLAIFVLFFIGKEFGDSKTGLFTAFFAATTLAFITRTSGGMFEKESMGGIFMLLSILFFIRAFKKSSWKYGIASGISLAIMSTVWGGVSFMYYLYAAFLFLLFLANIVLVILDYIFSGFKDALSGLDRFFGMDMVKAFVPTIVLGTVVQQFLPFHLPMTSLQIVVPWFAMTLLLVRVVADKRNLVKKEYLHYVLPAAMMVGFIALIVGAMFSDYLMGVVDSLIGFSPRSTGVVGTTVAENTPGSWNEFFGTFSAASAGAIIPIPIGQYFSLWIFVFLGFLVLFYRLYRTKDWIYLLPVLWVSMGIFGMIEKIRLMFFLGPAAAVVGGVFISWLVNNALNRYSKSVSIGIRKINVVCLLLAVFISLLVVFNYTSAYVFANQLGPPYSGPWPEAMEFLSEQTPENSVVLSWWDFGFWFQARGNRATVADGGNLGGIYGKRDYEIAEWFVSSVETWSAHKDWLKQYGVTHILMDYTLPQKYGAISRIASNGERVAGFLTFASNPTIFKKDNETIAEFTAGEYAVWIPSNNDGTTVVSSPMFLVRQNDEYGMAGYVNHVCTTAGIVDFGAKEPSLGGCISLSDYGINYLGPEEEFTIFANLMFMDGFGLRDPGLEMVFNNGYIRIYEVKY